MLGSAWGNGNAAGQCIRLPFFDHGSILKSATSGDPTARPSERPVFLEKKRIAKILLINKTTIFNTFF
jgi:hypothetical protein